MACICLLVKFGPCSYIIYYRNSMFHLQACERTFRSFVPATSYEYLIASFSVAQGNHIAGRSGRIHCSLNINTETGRLSARRPNLQVTTFMKFAFKSLIIEFSIFINLRPFFSKFLLPYFALDLS